MSKTQFTSVVWFVSLICLPLLVYIGTTITNITGIPFDNGYPLYDAKTGPSAALLMGVPFATIVTVLSACDFLRKDHVFKVWSATVMMAVLAIACLIVYETVWHG